MKLTNREQRVLEVLVSAGRDVSLAGIEISRRLNVRERGLAGRQLPGRAASASATASSLVRKGLASRCQSQDRKTVLYEATEAGSDELLSILRDRQVART